MKIEKELAEMQRMTVGQLREKYEDVFGETTRSGNKPWMVKRIAWRLQANQYGGLSERAKARAAELANDADIRVMPPKSPATIPIATRANVVARADGLVPGTEIVRKYKGRELRVLVLADGFQYEGERYDSLTSLAEKITNSHCSGWRFFNVRRPK